MARTEKYYLGRPLLDDIRRTVTRVDGLYSRTSGAALPVRLQTLQQPMSSGSGGVKVVRFSGTWNINTARVVTVVNSGQTVMAANISASFSGEGCGERYAVVAKEAASIPSFVTGGEAEWILVTANFF